MNYLFEFLCKIRYFFVYLQKQVMRCHEMGISGVMRWACQEHATIIC
jgi:hypothetical protein